MPKIPTHLDEVEAKLIEVNTYHVYRHIATCPPTAPGLHTANTKGDCPRSSPSLGHASGQQLPAPQGSRTNKNVSLKSCLILSSSPWSPKICFVPTLVHTICCYVLLIPYYSRNYVMEPCTTSHAEFMGAAC
jgi:hypothetical protein